MYKLSLENRQENEEFYLREEIMVRDRITCHGISLCTLEFLCHIYVILFLKYF